jgi:hypothetical protein
MSFTNALVMIDCRSYDLRIAVDRNSASALLFRRVYLRIWVLTKHVRARRNTCGIAFERGIPIAEQQSICRALGIPRHRCAKHRFAHLLTRNDIICEL